MNTSATKASKEVGVVLSGDRFSSALMWPEFKRARELLGQRELDMNEATAIIGW